jgi:DNA repair protein RadD
MITQLRPSQVRLIELIRGEIRAGKKRIVVYGATGFGKSVVIEALTQAAIGKGKRVAIIANRIHLVRQLSERFNDAGIHHGIVQGDNSHTTHAAVIICSIQTVAKRGMPPVDFLIIDEGHACAGSKDYRKVIFQNNNLPVLAFSATPFSRGMAKQHKELCGEPLFESLVVSATIRELISDGHLVDVDIFAPSAPDLTGVRKQRNQFGEMDYNEQDLATAVDRPTLVGNIVSHWLKMSKGKPTVCFATSIAHSKHIVEQFMASGVDARHIDCYLEQEEKDQILDDFKAGKFTVLSNVSLIAEGFDYPACAVMILARPTKSLIRYLQMVGRILRPHHSKDRGLLLDHSGSVHELGYPTDDLPLELDDGNSKPKEAKKEAKEKTPKPCPKCHYMKPAGQRKCVKCGFEPEVQSEVVNADGDLALVDRKKEKFSMDEKRGIYEALLGYAEKKGIKPGWAYHKTKEITGVYPTSTTSAKPGPMVEAVRNWFAYEAIKRSKGEKRAA